MPERVQGHYRAGRWIAPYTRRDKQLDQKVKVSMFETEEPRGDRAKELHSCCEGVRCCGCDKPLTQGEMEPVGMREDAWHRLCGSCLWERF